MFFLSNGFPRCKKCVPPVSILTRQTTPYWRLTCTAVIRQFWDVCIYIGLTQATVSLFIIHRNRMTCAMSYEWLKLLSHSDNDSGIEVLCALYPRSNPDFSKSSDVFLSFSNVTNRWKNFSGKTSLTRGKKHENIFVYNLRRRWFK